MKKALIFIAFVSVITIAAVSVYFGSFNQPQGTSSSQPEQKLTINTSQIETTQRMHGLSQMPYPYFEQRDGYNHLEKPAMQQLYQEIGNNACQISDDKNENGNFKLNEININQPMTAGEIRKALIAFQYDHPNVFWLANEYDYTLNGTQSKIQLYSYVSSDKQTEMQVKLNKKIDEIVQQIPLGLSEMERELAVCKVMERTCAYDDAAAENTDLWESFTVYGAFINGKAVCQGYAKAVQSLLSDMNMDCRLVNGNANGMPHMWNLVKVDGDWYHLDVTWIDNDTMPAYQYFNLTDKQMMYDHTISPDYADYTDEQLANGAVFNFKLPSCVSDQANYMKQTQILINGTDSNSDQEIVDGIVRELESGADILCFTVNETLDFNETVDRLFQKSPYQFIEYIEAANKRLSSDKRVDYHHCIYAVDQSRRYIKVKIALQQ